MRLHCCCLYAGLRQGRRAKNCRKALASAALETGEAYCRKTNVAYVRKRARILHEFSKLCMAQPIPHWCNQAQKGRISGGLRLPVDAPAWCHGAIRYRNE